MLLLLVRTPAVMQPRPVVTPRTTTTQMSAGPGPQSGWGTSVAAQTWGAAAPGRSAAERAARRRSNASPAAMPAAAQPRSAAERAAQRAARGPSPSTSTQAATPSTSTQPRTAAERAARRATRPAESTPRVAQPRNAAFWSAQRAAGSAQTTATKMVPSSASYIQNPPSTTDGAVSRFAERSQRKAQSAQRLVETQPTSPLVAAQRTARSKAAKGVVVPTGRPAPAPTSAR